MIFLTRCLKPEAEMKAASKERTVRFAFGMKPTVTLSDCILSSSRPPNLSCRPLFNHATSISPQSPPSPSLDGALMISSVMYNQSHSTIVLR